MRFFSSWTAPLDSIPSTNSSAKANPRRNSDRETGYPGDRPTAELDVDLSLG